MLQVTFGMGEWFHFFVVFNLCTNGLEQVLPFVHVGFETFLIGVFNSKVCNCIWKLGSKKWFCAMSVLLRPIHTSKEMLIWILICMQK